jgi:SAM-dependent methyltransferase
MKDLLSARRRQLELDLSGSPQRWLFSAVAHSQYRVTLPPIVKYAAGELIGVGCGDMPFRPYIAGQINHYDGLDIAPRSPQLALSYLADIQNMAIVPSNAYDTALCLEVLEHIPDPFRAMGEIHRILKPGGRVIISVPHLSRLHEEPHDYYRYTAYGLKTLAQVAHLEVLSVLPRGGLFSFLGHQISTVILGLTWHMPVVGKLVWFLNRIIFTRWFYWLDTSLSTLSAICPLGYTMVAEKPNSDHLDC